MSDIVRDTRVQAVISYVDLNDYNWQGESNTNKYGRFVFPGGFWQIRPHLSGNSQQIRTYLPGGFWPELAYIPSLHRLVGTHMWWAPKSAGNLKMSAPNPHSSMLSEAVSCNTLYHHASRLNWQTIQFSDNRLSLPLYRKDQCACNDCWAFTKSNLQICSFLLMICMVGAEHFAILTVGLGNLQSAPTLCPHKLILCLQDY